MVLDIDREFLSRLVKEGHDGLDYAQVRLVKEVMIHLIRVEAMLFQKLGNV